MVVGNEDKKDGKALIVEDLEFQEKKLRLYAIGHGKLKWCQDYNLQNEWKMNVSMFYKGRIEMMWLNCNPCLKGSEV